MTPENTGKSYYSKFAYDGRVFFVKETNHHEAAGYHYSKENKRYPAGMAKGKWLGMKFICRTRGHTVKQEQYEEMSDGANGGRWVKVAEVIDNGHWAESRISRRSRAPSSATTGWARRRTRSGRSAKSRRCSGRRCVRFPGEVWKILKKVLAGCLEGD